MEAAGRALQRGTARSLPLLLLPIPQCHAEGDAGTLRGGARVSAERSAIRSPRTRHAPSAGADCCSSMSLRCALCSSWSGWWLTPSLQLAMSFTHGTPCNDDVDRSVVAVLQCSLPPHAPSSVPLSILAAAERAPPHVADVVEPSMCSYELHYHTPLVCALYDRVRAEAEWRWLHPSTPISRLRRRRDADDDSAAIDAQDEADERRLAAWRATWPSEAPAAAAASADERSEIRDLLACIAGMSMDGATHSTYAALCAPFLQSAEPIAATNSTANASGQR